MQKQPVEALFRSLCLVLLDNASAEYTFLVRFFSPLPETSSVTSSPHAGAISLSTTDLPVHRSHADSPASKFDRRESTYSLASSPIAPSTVEGSPIIYAPSPLRPSDSVSDAGDDEPPRIISRTRSTGVAGSPIGSRPATTTRSVRQSFRGESVVASPASLVGSGAGRGEMSRDVRKELEGIWHQVFDTALEYCDVRAPPVAGFGKVMLMVFPGKGILQIGDGTHRPATDDTPPHHDPPKRRHPRRNRRPRVHPARTDDAPSQAGHVALVSETDGFACREREKDGGCCWGWGFRGHVG